MSSLVLLPAIILVFIDYNKCDQNVISASNDISTCMNQTCGEMWIGDAPFCHGSCPDGFNVEREDNCGDGRCCWSGQKKLCKSCTDCVFQYVGNFPFCNPSKCPVGWKLSEYSKCGDGYCCWTGQKMKCVQNDCDFVKI